MPRGRRDSYSDDDSYDRTPPRRRNDRDDDRRDNRRGGHRDDRRDNRRDNRRDDERDDRRDNGRHRQRDVSPDDSRHRRDPKKSRRASPDDSLREIKPPKKQKIPTKVNRSCTDILFLLLFLIFFAAWIALATIVFSQVNMGELVADMVKDGKDQTCGSEGTPGRFLYIHNFKEAFKMNGLLPQIDFKDKERWCVKECPKKFINFTKPGNLEGNVCFAEAAERIDKITTNEEKWKQLHTEIKAKECAQFVYPTHEILSFCIPDIGKLRKDSGNIENSDSTDSSAESNTVGPESYASNAIDSIKGAADSIAKMAEPETIVQIILDLWVSRFPIFAGFGVSLILALLWMLLMRWFAGIIVWVTTLLFPVVFGGLTGLSVYWTLDIWNDEFKPFDMKSITNVVYLASRYEFRLAVSVLVGIIFLLTVLIILFLRKRIAIAVALIKQASRSISHLPTLVIFPVMPYVLQAVGVAFGVTIYFLISTVRAKMEIEGSNLEEQCNEAVDGVAGGSLAGRKICGFVYSVLAKGWYIHVFNIFSSFWVVMFVGAFSYMVVAHAVARYFWTHKAEGSQCMAVGASVGTTARYHLGTIALGSLIVSIVSVIRIVLEWFQGKTKKDKNSCANFLARCCLCCFYMLEKFLKYINKNAYIMVAMYGKNFCRSAGKAFSLIMSNALRALVVTKLTDFVIFIAKVVTSACAATILYFVYQSDSLRESLSLPELFSVFVPVIATGIGSFVVTSCFFNVYRSAVDTLFLCFLEDKKINDGSRERPYRMPTELKRIFDRKNHK